MLGAEKRALKSGWQLGIQRRRDTVIEEIPAKSVHALLAT